MDNERQIPHGVTYEWLECLECKKCSEKVRHNDFLTPGKGGGGYILIDGETDYFIKFDLFLLCHSHDKCVIKRRTYWDSGAKWLTDGKEQGKPNLREILCPRCERWYGVLDDISASACPYPDCEKVAKCIKGGHSADTMFEQQMEGERARTEGEAREHEGGFA